MSVLNPQLSGGEYIAVEKLESVYKSASVVGEGMILANPQHRQPAMIVCVHPINFPQFVKTNGLGGGSEDVDKLCKDREVEKAVLKELNATGKKQGFTSLELLEAVILTPDEWYVGFVLREGDSGLIYLCIIRMTLGCPVSC
jgi:long-chain acyl-CoA synthetase